MKKITILILIVLVCSNYLTQESLAKTAVKKTDEIRCTYMYEKFKKMGEEKLHKRYPFYPIMNICLKLFHDPNWSFPEKNMIDKKYSFDSTDNIKSKGLLNRR